jgi:hypothetical protein
MVTGLQQEQIGFFLQGQAIFYREGNCKGTYGNLPRTLSL